MRELLRRYILRFTFHFSNALVMSTAFIGILLVVNYISARHYRRFDMTEEKKYTLSEQTVQILRELAVPIKITGFFVEGSPQETTAQDLLRAYEYHSDKISYELVDPERSPALARQFDVTNYSVLVVRSGAKRQDVTVPQEKNLTSAILNVSRDITPKVYFIIGHGEHSPEDAGPEGYSQLRDRIERENYEIAALNLGTITDTLPTDADAVVVAGATTPYAENEIEMLRSYIAGGGRAFFLLNPSNEPNVPEMLRTWGIAPRADLVIDPPNSFFGDMGTVMVTSYEFHEITKNLARISTVMPLARSLKIDMTVPNAQHTPLLQTSAEAWGETNLADLRNALPDANDAKGPLTLAVATKLTENSGRLVVLGDSDFVGNGFIQQMMGTANLDLFLNALNWLTEQEELIAVRPKEPAMRPINLTPPERTFATYSSAALLPLLFLIAGAVVWWRRK